MEIGRETEAATGGAPLVLFVDYENVTRVDLGAIPSDVIVPFFFGASQKSVPTDFLKAALKLGDRFVPIDIEGQGKNALDFHIAFYLGEHLAKNGRVKGIVLSKDKGFDPLVKHLRARGFDVRRASILADAFPAVDAAKPKMASSRTTVEASAGNALSVASALAFLRKMQPKARPRKREGLISHLRSHYHKASEAEVQRVIDQLIAEKKVGEVDGKMAYQL